MAFPSLTHILHVSEQLIPMLGLVPLEQIHRPKTTVDKVFFLIKHGSELHRPTAMIAFGVLGALLALKLIKGSFKSGWIKGIPEVLVIVIASTCTFGEPLGLSAPW
jgi:hypothetical protein